MVTTDIPQEFINRSLILSLQAFKEGKYERRYSDLKLMYFVGATLCLDIEDEFGFSDVITICHSDETYGLFSGGIRRLLPIKALKTLELLMKEQDVKHNTKWL
jgi:hypothetical protein